MKTLVAVPMNELALAKSRLAGLLDGTQRQQFALELFIHGQRFLKHAFPGLERLVVTPCPVVTSWAQGLGARVAHDRLAGNGACARGEGLNSAAACALDHARRQGHDALLLLPGDLPELDASEFDRLWTIGVDGSAVVVPAHDGGTNALLLPVASLPPDWVFWYGPDSAARHKAALVRAGVPVQTLALPSLSRDVDTPEDYAALMRLQRTSGRAGTPLRMQAAAVHPALPLRIVQFGLSGNADES